MVKQKHVGSQQINSHATLSYHVKKAKERKIQKEIAEGDEDVEDDGLDDLDWGQLLIEETPDQTATGQTSNQS